MAFELGGNSTFLKGKIRDELEMAHDLGFGGIVTGFEKFVHCGEESLGIGGARMYEV